MGHMVVAAASKGHSTVLATLTDYLAEESLQRLQDEFASALRVPVRVCSPEGVPVAKASPAPPEGAGIDEAPGAGSGGGLAADAGGAASVADVPIVLEGELLGRLIVPPQAGAPGPTTVRLLQLMATVIARRWNRQKLLRTRIAELATMYRLTAEFTGRRDLQNVLDLVTRTVVELLGARACALRLLNEDQTELVVKSVANLSPEYLNKGPILLSESQIDREVVTEGKTVTIADLMTDPRVLYPAEAAREGIVSGLCAPVTYKGHCEGVIRVYMAERHEFDWYQRSLLEAIAAQAAAAIVNARLYEEAVHSANLRRHVSLAGEAQRRMFANETPKREGFDIEALYVPCFELGGDFYDFHELGADNLGVAVCDVVGKGIRASLLMASIRASLRAHAANIYDMSDVLARVNRDLCAATGSSDFATLFYGVLDTKKRRLTYANAGHLPPLLIRQGRCSPLTARGGVIGIDPEWTWRHETMPLSPGDVLLIFTDGLTEALNFQDEPFGQARVERAALSAVERGLTARGIAQHALWEMRRFAGLQTRFDDLTLVAIRVS